MFICVYFVCHQLIDTAMDQASDVFKLNEDHELLAALKSSGLNGLKERVDELSVKFEEHADQLMEVRRQKPQMAKLHT